MCVCHVLILLTYLLTYLLRRCRIYAQLVMIYVCIMLVYVGYVGQCLVVCVCVSQLGITIETWHDSSTLTLCCSLLILGSKGQGSG